MARSVSLGLKGRKPRAKAEGLEPVPPDQISRPVGPKLRIPSSEPQERMPTGRAPDSLSCFKNAKPLPLPPAIECAKPASRLAPAGPGAPQNEFGVAPVQNHPIALNPPAPEHPKTSLGWHPCKATQSLSTQPRSTPKTSLVCHPSKASQSFSTPAPEHPKTSLVGHPCKTTQSLSTRRPRAPQNKFGVAPVRRRTQA